MSSHLLVHGAWTFPPRRLTKLAGAPLRYPEHEHQEGSLAAAFAGRSRARRGAHVLGGKCDRFLRFPTEGDTLLVRGVLTDDCWVEQAARLGALARAARDLGARGALAVHDDGRFVGRLVLGPSAVSFDPRASPRLADTKGRRAVEAIWTELDAAASPKKRPATRRGEGSDPMLAQIRRELEKKLGKQAQPAIEKRLRAIEREMRRDEALLSRFAPKKRPRRSPSALATPVRGATR